MAQNGPFPRGTQAQGMHHQSILSQQQFHVKPPAEHISPRYPLVGGQVARVPQVMYPSDERRNHRNRDKRDGYPQADQYSSAASYARQPRGYSNRSLLHPSSVQSSEYGNGSNAHVYNVVQSHGPRRGSETAPEMVPEYQCGVQRPLVSRPRDYPPLQLNPDYWNSVGATSAAPGRGSRSVCGGATQPALSGISRSFMVKEDGKHDLWDPRYRVAELP